MKNSLMLILLFSGHLGFAQGFYNKSSVISIASQTLLTVPDSLVNNVNSTIINNGDLRISGAWVNLGTYDAGAGQINFDSDLTQTINHSDQSFTKLVISGAGEKMFSANITIESELDLQDGVLKSDNNSKIILNPGVVVSGGSDQSHIQGTIEVKGAGDWLFPMGNGSTYLPVEISNVTDPAAVATLTLHELTPGQVLTSKTEITRVSTQRYWELELEAGTLNQSRIKLPVYDEGDLTSDLDFAVVAGSATALGPYASFGGLEITGTLSAGSVKSSQAPSVAFYALAALASEPDIEVFNGVSENSDGINDFMKIINIEFYPKNKVSIFNRWGDRVFEMTGYNNAERNFRGESNISGTSKLPAGTYFYTIHLGNGSGKKTGYLMIK
jgi:gliding motility-associated-like protein